MKCPHCRNEISMIAEICPYCRSDLSEYYSDHGADISEMKPFMNFMVQWVFQTFMLYIPFLIFVGVVFRDLSDLVGWLGFITSAVIALIYRNKLPVP